MLIVLSSSMHLSLLHTLISVLVINDKFKTFHVVKWLSAINENARAQTLPHPELCLCTRLDSNHATKIDVSRVLTASKRRRYNHGLENGRKQRANKPM